MSSTDKTSYTETEPHTTEAADSQEALNRLHLEIAVTIAKVIREGIPMKDEDTGLVHYAPVSPAYLSNAIAFLKNNKIEGVKAAQGVLQALDDPLPFAVTR